MNKESLRDMMEKNHTSKFGWALYSWICDGEEAAEVLRSNHFHVLEKDHRSKKRQDCLFLPASEEKVFEDRISGDTEKEKILELLGKCCI